jgi:N-acetylglucosaminyldiphosphoundecaprenol N-acetyl-beta-D-mannosaminyltransferase
MQNICELAAREGHKVFFFGASERVNKAAARILQKRYPELAIVGRSNGYLRDGEMPDLIGHINDSQAEILFLALGSPRQEKWFATYKRSLEYVKVCQGVGGTLDVIAGEMKRAPEIWQKYSLEWLYRLISDPKRINRQKVLPIFAVMVLLSKLKTLKGKVN